MNVNGAYTDSPRKASSPVTKLIVILILLGSARLTAAGQLRGNLSNGARGFHHRTIWWSFTGRLTTSDVVCL